MAPSLTGHLIAQSPSQNDSAFGTGSAGADDFLSREKALLGDDANQFSTSNDNAAFVEDDDDDLLGGGGGAQSGGGEEITEFESSFPDLGAQNEVCILSSTWIFYNATRPLWFGDEWTVLKYQN